MSIEKKIAKISIVGAGPGAIDLITVRGLRAIQNADVILYDALVNPDLLLAAPSSAIKLYVGKRAGEHSHSQEAINKLIVQMALTNGHVVRLKGGDPFVFGRGHEELMYAKANGIEVEVVPGISSCIAVPELQGVPLTRRGINESFWVLTATTRTGKLSKDIAIAVQSSATLVILMGLKKLPEIVLLLKKSGKEDTPVMVVENGSSAKERCVIGTVSTIIQEVREKEIKSPAIIVIGAVVNLHPSLKKISQPFLTSLSKHQKF